MAGSRISRILRPIVLTAALVAGSAYITHRHFPQITNLFSSRSSEMSDDSKASFSSFTDGPNGFLMTASGHKILNGGSADNSGIVSEAQAYLMLLGHAHEDHDLGRSATAGLTFLQDKSGRGLPPWNYEIEGTGTEKNLTIKGSSSAIDADMDATTAMIWSHAKESEQTVEVKILGKRMEIKSSDIWGNVSAEKIQSMLDMIWPAMNYDGAEAVPGPSEDWGNGKKALHSASYFSIFEFERFAGYDANDSHDWMAVAKSVMKIREKILLDHLYQSVPDFMYVSHDSNGTFHADKTDETKDKKHRSTMGFDGIRAFLRIGIDCATVIDPELKRRNIELARKAIDALGKTPADIAIAISNVPLTVLKEGEIQSFKEPETALAAFTALAYGASLSLGAGDSNSVFYGQIYEHLEITFRSQALTADSSQIAKDYYKRALQQLTLALIDGGFEKQPTSTLFTRPGMSHELQAFCNDMPEWYARRGYELTNWDALSRAKAVIKGELDWLQDCHGPTWKDFDLPRREAAKDISAYRLRVADDLGSVRLFNSQVWMLTKAFEGLDAKKDRALLAAVEKKLSSALKESGVSAYAAVKVFEDVLASYKGSHNGKTNPFIELGLAQALADTYNRANLVTAFDIATRLVGSQDKFLVARANQVTAQVCIAQANFAAGQMNATENIKKLREASTYLDTALNLETGEKELAQLYTLKAETRLALYKVAKDPESISSPEASRINAESELSTAIHSYEKILKMGFKDETLEVRTGLETKATLGLSSCLREKKEYAKALDDVDYQLIVINRQYAVDPLGNRYMDANYLMLQTERIRIYRGQADDQLQTAATSLATSLPSGRIRPSFERMRYFLDKGEFVKARKDAKMLTELATTLSNPTSIAGKLLAEPDIKQLQAIIVHIRTDILPKISNTELKPEERARILGELGEHLAALSPKAQALFSIKGEEFEGAAEDAERLIELNAFLRDYGEKPTGTYNKQVGVLGIAAQVFALFPEDGGITPNNVTAAKELLAKAVELCTEDLREKPLTADAIEAMLKFYEGVVWILSDKDATKGEAIALAEELLGRGRLGTRVSPLASTVALSLRDPEIRSAIDGQMQKPSSRQELFGMLGKLYKDSDNEKALEYFRQSLGLEARASIEAERVEYVALIKERPELKSALFKLLDIRTDDAERNLMFEQLRQ